MSGMGPYANIAHFDGEPLLAVQGFLGCAALLGLLTTAPSCGPRTSPEAHRQLTRQLEAALQVSGQVAGIPPRGTVQVYWLGEVA